MRIKMECPYKKESENKHNKKKITILSYIAIIDGVIIFVLRFIPFYDYESNTISLDQAASFCNSYLGILVGDCNWIKLLDFASYIIPLAFVGYGIYLVITKKDKNKIIQ
jgi:hypothetical protein